jgi:hypothetical protein
VGVLRFLRRRSTFQSVSARSSECAVCIPHVLDWRSLREVDVDLGSEPVFFHRGEVGVQGC